MVTTTLINNEGKAISLDRTYNETPTRSQPTQFSIGIEQADPSVASTSLTHPVPIEGTTTINDCEVTTGWTASTDGALTVNSTTYKEGSNSISIAKSGSTEAFVGASRTISSIDITTSRIDLWIYLVDKTDLIASGTGIQVQAGQDSSNYYYKNFDIADLESAWNYLYLSSTDNSGETGSPTASGIVYFNLVFYTDNTSDTIAADRVLMDDIKLAGVGTFFENFMIDTTIDYTTRTATMKCYLNNIQANGYDFDGVMIFNNDTTKVSQSITKLTAESKSSTDEFSLIFVDQYI